MSRKSILIVEDEGLIALHLQELLEQEGYHVAGTAFSGEMALKRMEKPPYPDLILMDIALAGEIDGVETARRIRREHDIPVIYLTAYSNKNRIEEANAVSPYGYLMKPVMTDELFRAIRSAFDQKAGRKTGKEPER